MVNFLDFAEGHNFLVALFGGQAIHSNPLQAMLVHQQMQVGVSSQRSHV